MSQKSSKKSPKSSHQAQKRTDSSVEIFGVSISGTRLNQVLKTLFVQRKNLLHVATVNPEFVMEARRNPRFMTVLHQTDLTVADGWGIVWADKILHGTSILPADSSSRHSLRGRVPVERISGTELVKIILERAMTRGEKVFLLGAQPGVAEKAAIAMKKMYQTLEIAWYEGARTVQVEKNEEASMTIAKINAFEPDYLLVAYGSPWQDIWIEENRPYLRARVAIGVGGVLDEWAGVVRPCPQWLDSIGGKWVWRLVTQPWRWRRIVRVLGFGVLVFYHKLID